MLVTVEPLRKLKAPYAVGAYPKDFSNEQNVYFIDSRRLRAVAGECTRCEHKKDKAQATPNRVGFIQ